MRNHARSFIGLAVAALILLVAAVFTDAQTKVVPARITSAIDPSHLTVLRGNTNPLAQARFDRGAAPASMPMRRMLLVLKRSAQQEDALETLLEQQQNASSPSYHHWLTPQQFGQEFGPSDQDIQTITSWLQSQGFQIDQVSNGRTVIEFSGTAGEVQAAFHTTIHQYLVNGENHWANSSDPQIPTALTPVVAGVWTLHNFLKKPQIEVLNTRFPAKVNPGIGGQQPQVTFSGPPTEHALAPADFAKIYNLDPSYQPPPGFNLRLAVVGRSNINIQDVESFDAYLPLNTLNRTPSPTVILNGPDPGDLGGSEEAEAVLDTSWSGALLANSAASVFLVVSSSTYTTDGADLSELYIIDNDFADVMTESFGDCEANYTAAEAAGISSLAEQAAAEGITYTVSTGDSGSEGCDNPQTEITASGPLSVNVLASTPYTIAVGGTQFNENGNDSAYWSSTNAQGTLESAIKYIPENVWNQSCTAANCGQNANIYAGGGGASILFLKPAWQSAVSGIPSDGYRDVPDVSLSASGHDPYLICLDGSCTPNAQGYISFAGIAGTSASAPSFAGIVGLVDQAIGSRQGQADYVLYRLAAAESLSQCNGSSTSSPPSLTNCVFNDVTTGNNAVPGEAGYGNSSAKYQSGTGYDQATGLGSVNITNLISKWGTARSTPSAVSSFQLNPTSGVTHGSPVAVNITVAPQSGTGQTPTGDVALIANLGTIGTAVDHFTLANGTVSATTTNLPGGSYTVTAHYQGDGTYTPSDFSPPIQVDISPEASTTKVAIITFDPNTGQVLDSNASTVTFGSPYTLRMTVAGTSGGTCSQTLTIGLGCPTGTITLGDNGHPLDGTSLGPGAYSLNNQGYAEDQTVQLLGGSHALSATYSGDSSFGGSSGSDAVTVSPASTSTGLTATPAKVGAGGNMTLTATVTTQSNSGAQGIYPTGSVQFMSDGNSIGSAPLAGSINTQTGYAQAVAVLNTTSLSQGTHNLTAVYSGDSNYLASSPSAAVSVSVLPSTTTVVTASSSSVVQGSSVTFTATVTPSESGGTALTGTVQFASNGTNLGSPVSISGGQAQLTTSSLPVGSDQITATYSGDSNYASSSGSTSETVTSPPTFTITANPSAILISSPGLSNSTTLTFTSEGGLSGSATLTPSSCSNLPAESGCSFSPATINLSANGTAATTLAIGTTAPSAVVPGARDRWDIGGWNGMNREAVLALAMLLLLALGMMIGLRGRPRRWGLVFPLVAFVFVFANVGCGGGGSSSTTPSNPGTPVGMQNAIVSVTIDGVTQTVPITVNVQ